MKSTPSPLFKSGGLAALIVGISLLATPGYAAAAQMVTGEVVDLKCYLDHGARGDKHAECASKCIAGGGPVGLLTADKQLYLVVGGKSLSPQLAPLAGKTLTLTGKLAERNGMKMIENAEIQK